ncbi:MAG: orotidine-5'-phosphate decarboxylase [Ignavibacteria bacterium]|jgi:orotidine-5'-phosphate decarboxylase|nr:orotidine-5'-phosphate decarboxylase [Ignavibacteria bacterium]MCU7503982.1 orotidine-5'-phosphate decarboxylase [Ignavibacteria bacterium]MCU7515354.1 orotidine-5'-phosphate decarboxylase [Ignavibacteria bacterium]
MTAQEKLQLKLKSGRHIAVGLDTDIKKIPQHLLKEKEPVLKFNEIIIEYTYEYAASYKLNLAFYEKDGSRGLEQLQRTLELIPQDVLTIGDAKRGDIGNTSNMYAVSLFEHFKFDAVTLHPYMGFDSVEPFLQYEDKLSFMLALTSNPGSSDFEKMKLDNGQYLFQQVISKVKDWNSRGNCGIVFGATNEKELLENVDSFEGLTVLLPGVGAQGGSLEGVVKAFKKSQKEKFLVNVSRALIYRSQNEDFGKAAKQEIISLNNRVSEVWHKG